MRENCWVLLVKVSKFYQQNSKLLAGGRSQQQKEGKMHTNTHTHPLQHLKEMKHKKAQTLKANKYEITTKIFYV